MFPPLFLSYPSTPFLFSFPIAVLSPITQVTAFFEHPRFSYVFPQTWWLSKTASIYIVQKHKVREMMPQRFHASCDVFPAWMLALPSFGLISFTIRVPGQIGIVLRRQRPPLFFCRSGVGATTRLLHPSLTSPSLRPSPLPDL